MNFKLNKLQHINSSLIRIIAFGLSIEIFFITIIRLDQPTSSLYFYLLCLLLTVAMIFYFLAAFVVREEKTTFSIIFFFALLFNITFLFTGPISSSDVYSYIYQGRVLAIEKANPYKVTYSNFKDDTVYNELNNKWSANTTPYGPVFTSLSAAIAKIAGNNIKVAVLLFKIIFISASLMVGWLIYRYTGSSLSAIFYLWNPLIVFELAGNAHNEALQLLFLIAGFSLLTKSKNKSHDLIAWLLLLLSCLIKPTTAIILPFFFLYIIFKEKEVNRRLTSAVVFFLLSVAALLISVLPFWFNGFISKYLSTTGLSSAIFVSPLISILLIFENSPGLLSPDLAIKIARTIFMVFAALFILDSFKTERHALLPKSALLYAIFLLCFFSWFMPWYIIIVLGLLVLFRKDREKISTEAMLFFWTLFGILHYVILR